MDNQVIIIDSSSEDSTDTLTFWERFKAHHDHLKQQEEVKVENLKRQFNIQDCFITLNNLTKDQIVLIKRKLVTKNPKSARANFQKLSDYVFEEKEKLLELDELEVKLKDLRKKKLKLKRSLKSLDRRIEKLCEEINFEINENL